jgi:hypothetical protein
LYSAKIYRPREALLVDRNLQMHGKLLPQPGFQRGASGLMP